MIVLERADEETPVVEVHALREDLHEAYVFTVAKYRRKIHVVEAICTRKAEPLFFGFTVISDVFWNPFTVKSVEELADVVYRTAESLKSIGEVKVKVGGKGIRLFDELYLVLSKRMSGES